MTKDFKGYEFYRGLQAHNRKKQENAKTKKLSAGHALHLAHDLGLKPGDIVTSGGCRYSFGRVGGTVIDDAGQSHVWIWAYRMFKNGSIYADPTRLDRWEIGGV